jgi:ubiquinone/menaquinone biosynthesis C-methylase UbiE
MAATDTDNDLRTHLRDMWAAVAPGWEEHADYVTARGRQVSERMLALTSPLPGQRVLELACGAGDVGLAAAALVAPAGEVVLSDAVPEMTAIAAQQVAARGLDSVRTRTYGVEQIAEPDASFDVVVCREGLMFAPDPARAAREIRRVLRPGGRFAVAVWGPRARNPWLGVVLDATSAQLGAPFPPPGIPGPFALEDAGRLAALLTDAGLADVAVEELDVPLRAGSLEEWWTRTCALAGPLAKVLASLPAPAAEALRQRAQAAAAAFEDDGGLSVPGVTLIASGRR